MFRKEVGVVNVVIETDCDTLDEHERQVGYVIDNIVNANYRNPHVKFFAAVAEFGENKYQARALGTPSPEISAVLDELTDPLDPS